MTHQITILNGPNLNMLGVREPDIYGHHTLTDVEYVCREKARALGVELAFHQSNHEGVLVDWIHEARDKAGGIIINPAGYTFTSMAIFDALKIFEGPTIELHISNVHKRGELYQHSLMSKVVTCVICGLGVNGYPLALTAMAQMLDVIPGEF
jgi:3-dehydroquinate dehydratase-2